MKFIHYLIPCILFIITSCAPIPVEYTNTSKDNSSTKELNNGLQKITFSIKQKHYINKKLNNLVCIELLNNSNDTLFFIPKTLFIISSEIDLIDSTSLKEMILYDIKSKITLLPNEKLRLTKEYWSENLKFSFKDYRQKAEKKQIRLILEYKTNNHIYKDSISLIPNFNRNAGS